MLRLIAEKAPGSLDELARLTGRAKSNLSRTLKSMEGYGLVRLERGERGRIAPRVTHDRVELDLPLTKVQRTVELLDDGHVVLANGWELRHAYKVERRCAEDTQSLRLFIARFGEYATTTFDLESQRVVRVTCLGEPPETTVPTVADTALATTTSGG